MDGEVRDVWIPLEKVNKGEVRLQIETATIDEYDGSKVYVVVVLYHNEFLV